MTKPTGYITHADMRAAAAPLIAAYLARGGRVHCFPEGAKAL